MIEVGDLVEIIDKGRTYSSYNKFIETNTPHLIRMFKSGRVMDNGVKGDVVFKGLHRDDRVICIVKILFEDKIIIINEKGLEKIE